MAKKMSEAEGKVIEAQPNAMFIVEKKQDIKYAHVWRLEQIIQDHPGRQGQSGYHRICAEESPGEEKLK
ncbi:MAG: hypothetical protein ACLRTA_04795 [Clostridia bacterium]